MPLTLYFAMERQPSAKSHVDTVPAPVIHERDKQRAFSDLDSVDAREADASTDPARVLDGNRVSRGSIFHRRLVRGPSLGDAGINRQKCSVESQTEQGLDARALQPACRARVPGPATASDMRRSRVYVGAYDIGLDFVAIRVGAGSRMIDGIEQREKLRRLVALTQRGERHDRPGRRVRVLATILANPGRIALDVSWIVRSLVVRRREQKRQSILAPNQVPIERGHRTGRATTIAVMQASKFSLAVTRAGQPRNPQMPIEPSKSRRPPASK